MHVIFLFIIPLAIAVTFNEKVPLDQISANCYVVKQLKKPTFCSSKPLSTMELCPCENLSFSTTLASATSCPIVSCPSTNCPSIPECPKVFCPEIQPCDCPECSAKTCPSSPPATECPVVTCLTSAPVADCPICPEFGTCAPCLCPRFCPELVPPKKLLCPTPKPCVCPENVVSPYIQNGFMTPTIPTIPTTPTTPNTPTISTTPTAPTTPPIPTTLTSTAIPSLPNKTSLTIQKEKSSFNSTVFECPKCASEIYFGLFIVTAFLLAISLCFSGFLIMKLLKKNVGPIMQMDMPDLQPFDFVRPELRRRPFPPAIDFGAPPPLPEVGPVISAFTGAVITDPAHISPLWDKNHQRETFYEDALSHFSDSDGLDTIIEEKEEDETQI